MFPYPIAIPDKSIFHIPFRYEISRNIISRTVTKSWITISKIKSSELNRSETIRRKKERRNKMRCISFPDVDECAQPDLQTEMCRYGCINTPGSYRCAEPMELKDQPILDSLSITCLPGYEATPDGTCIGKWFNPYGWFNRKLDLPRLSPAADTFHFANIHSSL